MPATRSATPMPPSQSEDGFEIVAAQPAMRPAATKAPTASSAPAIDEQRPRPAGHAHRSGTDRGMRTAWQRDGRGASAVATGLGGIHRRAGEVRCSWRRGGARAQPSRRTGAPSTVAELLLGRRGRARARARREPDRARTHGRRRRTAASSARRGGCTTGRRGGAGCGSSGRRASRHRPDRGRRGRARSSRPRRAGSPRRGERS